MIPTLRFTFPDGRTVETAARGRDRVGKASTVPYDPADRRRARMTGGCMAAFGRLGIAVAVGGSLLAQALP